MTLTSPSVRSSAAKVPAVTLGFWGLKILATTLGETGGDWVTMSLKLGYLAGCVIFAVAFIALVAGQVRAYRFKPVLYWATIVATTTLGTTLADFADRSLGLGYPGGVAVVLTLLVASLAAWRWREGTVSVQSVTTARAESFYWATILFSQTLGTALGDWTADDDLGGLGLGFEKSAALFALALLAVAILHAVTKVSRTALFWAAFVLTRPLGATLGDLLDKPHAQGGMAFSRLAASLILLVLIAGGIALLPQRAASSAAAP